MTSSVKRPNATPDYSAVMKNALQQIQDLKAKVAAADQRDREPIAIIGLGCRLPNEIHTPEQFWTLLSEGDNAIREVPKERWDLDRYFDPDPAAPGKTHVRYGSFVDEIDGFDPHFFNMSPREAIWLDPQQRLLLEVSWEALERANIVPETLLESSTGVFVGISGSEYEFLMAEHEAPDNLYGRTGVDTSVAAGRLSFLLGLTGPCVAVDTACSSSLVAIHQACQSLRQRECDLALAGGVGLILRPENTIAFSKVGMLAPDGRSKPFDAAADGFVRGEGCGLIVLKRLSDAVADQDNILAVIRGSMINHDGPSSGLTAPRGPSQQAVIRKALQRANLQPDAVSYIEVHGAGTPLGDPIELGALGAVFRKRERPLWVGSVKTNLGHLEAAAGIAGLMKVVLMLQHGQIPPHLHFKTPNPHIDWARIPVQIPTTLTPWDEAERVAGVSSFGFSGTNAHIVLSQAPVSQPEVPEKPVGVTRPTHLLTLSAKTELALTDLVNAYATDLARNPNLDLADLCYTSNVGRSHFRDRMAIAASSVAELQKQAARLAQGKRASKGARGQVGENTPGVAFLFTGQGSQYPNMGQQLYETEPLFRQTIERCSKILEPHLEHRLLDVLYPPGPETPTADLVNATQYAQPALFAVEYALAQLWQWWGVKPSVVLGHSTGEYVAACVAGVFSLDDGLRLIAERARLIASVSAGGATAAVFAHVDQVTEALIPFNGELGVAGINEPKETLIAGPAEAVDSLLAQLKERGIDSRKLEIPHAPHSPLMDPVLDEFEAIAQRIDFHPPQCKLISNVTGEVLEQVDATYWRRHMREAVHFSAGVRQLEASGCTLMVEIGPQPVLLWLGKQNWQGAKGVSWLASLWPIQQDWEQLLQSAGTLYTRGIALDWDAFHQHQTPGKITLPTYPWQRQRYWIPQSASYRTEQWIDADPSLHPLLGRRVDSVLFQQSEMQFETQLSTAYPAYLNDHRVYDLTILPTTAYLEMALQAGSETLGSTDVIVEHIAIQQALILPAEDENIVIQTVLAPAQEGYRWQIYSASGREAIPWQLHAEGVARTKEPTAREQTNLSALKAEFTQEIPVEEFYAHSERGNLHYGPRFRLVQQLWAEDERALGRIALTDEVAQDTKQYQLHPALLDACLQVSGAFFLGDETTYLPIGIERLERLAIPAAEVWCAAHLRATNNDLFTIDLSIYREDGTIVANIDGLQIKATTSQAIARRPAWHDWLYHVAWEECPLHLSLPTSDAERRSGRWLIFGELDGCFAQVTTLLRDRGDQASLISAGDCYAQLDEHTIQIDPTSPADYQTLFDQHNNITGVIHGWSVDHTGEQVTEDVFSADQLDAAAFTGCGTLLLLTQAMTNLRSLPPLWVVTQGAVASEKMTSLPGLAQSAIAGMTKVIRLEYPGTTCVHVDLDPQANAETVAQALVTELSALDDHVVEEQVAYREGRRYGARLARTTSIQEGNVTSTVIRADGTYLVTGGLGALGLLTARWIVEAGATRLILLGRREPKPAAQETLTTLEAMGATITVAQVDVTDAEQLATLLATVEEAFPLRGIIHAAGTLDDGALINQSWSRFQPVLAPKVTGAWHLHTLTKDAPLDFFVLFSSVAGLLGSAGQANHAAANAFLDVLAHYRRTQGLPALSINWGAWSEVGQAAEFVAQMAGTGMGAISPAQGMEVLANLLSTAQSDDAPQIGVMPMDWTRFGTLGSFLQRFRHAERAIRAETQNLVAQLVGKDLAAQEQVVTAYIQEEVADILQHDSGDAIDASHRFRELGMDSLTSMELRNRLQEALDCPLSAGIVFNFPSPDALATHIVQDLLTAEKIDAVDLTLEERPLAAPIAEDVAVEAIPMRTRLLEIRGFTLNLCEWGPEDAPLIVCQHGIMDQGRSWEQVAVTLVAQGYRIVAPDLRGHGESDHIGPGGSYHLRDFVGDLDGILHELKVDSFTLVGHSLGSLVAALYVAARPQRVQQLLLVEPIMPTAAQHSPAFVDQLQSHLHYLETTSPFNGAMNGVNGNGIAQSANSHTIMPTITVAADRLQQINAIPQAAARKMAELLTRESDGGLVWRWDIRLDAHDGVLMAGLTQDAYLELLAKIAVPIHVVYGEQSGWLNATEKAALQSVCPGLDPTTVVGGHNLHIEQPDALAAIILQTIPVNNSS